MTGQKIQVGKWTPIERERERERERKRIQTVVICDLQGGKLILEILDSGLGQND
jgi:hypothetical protein